MEQRIEIKTIEEMVSYINYPKTKYKSGKFINNP